MCSGHTCVCTYACLLNIHSHTAVSHRHGVVSQGVAGNLAVVGAADRGEGACMVGVDLLTSLVGSGQQQININITPTG